MHQFIWLNQVRGEEVWSSHSDFCRGGRVGSREDAIGHEFEKAWPAYRIGEYCYFIVSLALIVIQTKRDPIGRLARDVQVPQERPQLREPGDLHHLRVGGGRRRSSASSRCAGSRGSGSPSRRPGRKRFPKPASRRPRSSTPSLQDPSLRLPKAETVLL